MTGDAHLETRPASQRRVRPRVEEEQDVPGCAHLTCDHDCAGRMNALLDRVRTFPGRLSGHLTDPGRHRTPALPPPDPAPALGWSVHLAGRRYRTAAPGSCAGRRLQDHRASHLRGSRHHARSGRARHAPSTHI